MGRVGEEVGTCFVAHVCGQVGGLAGVGWYAGWVVRRGEGVGRGGWWTG